MAGPFSPGPSAGVDIEKDAAAPGAVRQTSIGSANDKEISKFQEQPAETSSRRNGILHRLAEFGRVEVRGIAPVPLEERVITKTYNVFTLWWSMNTNILGYVLGHIVVGVE